MSNKKIKLKYNGDTLFPLIRTDCIVDRDNNPISLVNQKDFTKEVNRINNALTESSKDIEWMYVSRPYIDSINLEIINDRTLHIELWQKENVDGYRWKHEDSVDLPLPNGNIGTINAYYPRRFNYYVDDSSSTKITDDWLENHVLEGGYTGKYTDMSYMFMNQNLITTIPRIDTHNVTEMDSMFAECSSLTSIPLLDTHNVIRMDYMFAGCSSLTSIPQLNVVGVDIMDYMFDSCIALKEIHMKNINANLDISDTILEHDALMEVISNLMPQVSGSKILTLGNTLTVKLSAEELKVATDKGWTIA